MRPDAPYDFYEFDQKRGVTGVDRIGLLPRQGAEKHTDLTGGLDLDVYKRPIAWVSNDFVP